MSYQYRAVEKFWRNFFDSVRNKKPRFEAPGNIKSDPFHPTLQSHEIHALSAKASHTIYSAVIESDLRVIFRIDGPWVTTLDVGTHKLYRA